MALLRETWEQALDPSYALSARGHDPQPRPRLAGLVALLLAGLLLAVGAVHVRASAPAAARERAALVASVRTQTANDDRLTARAAKLRQDVNRLKDQSLGTTAQGQQLAATLRQLEAVTGGAAVQGPGIRVTLDDGPDDSSTQAAGKPFLGRVLDRDLQQAVNGLWQAGAEAIAVNGQRLTATSAIRSAGDAILVDYRPLTRPYVIEAIGDPATMQAAFAASVEGRALRTLQSTYGIVLAVEGADSLDLPAAPATDLRYARTEDAR